MIKLNNYLNFAGNTEEAFNFYKSVFNVETMFLQRFSEVADIPNKEQMSDEDLNKVMHASILIGNDTLMGTDALETMGQHLKMGNNVSLSLHPDSKKEAERIFKALAEGGEVEMPLQPTFWGAIYGTLTDKFGIKWMVNFDSKGNAEN